MLGPLEDQRQNSNDGDDDDDEETVIKYQSFPFFLSIDVPVVAVQT